MFVGMVVVQAGKDALVVGGYLINLFDNLGCDTELWGIIILEAEGGLRWRHDCVRVYQYRFPVPCGG